MSQWGSITLAAGQTLAVAFDYGRVVPGFLPVISVVPLTPTFQNINWTIVPTAGSGPDAIGSQTSLSFPVANTIGCTALWPILSNDKLRMTYNIVVMNWSPIPLEFAFVDAGFNQD
jgi:hypothetical protein